MSVPLCRWRICSRTLELLAHHPGSIGGGFRDSCLAPDAGLSGRQHSLSPAIGVHPALAAASIGVSQVMAFGMHILLVLGFGLIGNSEESTSHRRAGRSSLESHSSLGWSCSSFCRSPDTGQNDAFVNPQPSRARLLTLAQTPSKLILGVSGFIVLNIGYCFCLVACVRAFGGGGEWAAICVVFLVGATVGQVAPTPGGLGAVEAALTAGLAGVGVEGGIALSAVLMFGSSPSGCQPSQVGSRSTTC